MPRRHAQPRRAQTRRSTPPSAICTTPATQNDGRCEFVPRLPRETKVDDSRCKFVPRLPRRMSRRHARPGRAQTRPSAPPSAMSATPATRNDGRCEFVPRLPRTTTVAVSLCHACHAECCGVTRDQGAPKPDQARHPVPSVPRLPRKRTVDVSLCHACHAKRQ